MVVDGNFWKCGFTSVARSWASVPRSPGRPLSILRRGWDFGRIRAWLYINTNNLVVIVTDANSAAECRRWICARTPTSLYREATGLRTRWPRRPCCPTTMDRTICYFDFCARATNSTVLWRWIIALPSLTLTRIWILLIGRIKFIYFSRNCLLNSWFLE